MTKQEVRETKASLEILKPLNEEIRLDKMRLRELRAVAEGTTRHITGLPYAASRTDKTALAGDIADLEAAISKKIARTMAVWEYINEWVMHFKNPTVRAIIQLKYADGLTWTQVERSMGLQSRDPGQVARRVLDRELENEEYVRFCTDPP